MLTESLYADVVLPELFVSVQAPINHLPPDLMSIIFIYGLPSLAGFSVHRWIKILKYLCTIGSVSGAWREVRDDTAALWTNIMYKYATFQKKREKNLAIFTLFILRSKGALLDLCLDCSGFYALPDTVADSVPHLDPHLHRCRSISFKGYHPVLVPSIFPIVQSTDLHALNVHVTHNGSLGSRGFPFLSSTLLGEGNKIKLRSLRSLDPRSPLDNIDTSSITHLDFGFRLDSTLLDFAIRCESLESLSIGLLSNAFPSLEQGDFKGVPIVSFPCLSYLKIHSQFPHHFSYIFDCPLLTHLDVFSLGTALTTAPPRARFCAPLLRTFTSWGYQPDRDEQKFGEFLHSHPQLRAIALEPYPRMEKVLTTFAANPDSIQSDGSYDRARIPCPHLELLRVFSHASSLVNYAAASIDILFIILSQRPALKLEWVALGSSDVLNKLQASFPERVSHIKSENEGTWEGEVPELYELFQ